MSESIFSANAKVDENFFLEEIFQDRFDKLCEKRRKRIRSTKKSYANELKKSFGKYFQTFLMSFRSSQKFDKVNLITKNSTKLIK